MQSGIDRRAESVGAVRFGECPGGAGARKREPDRDERHSDLGGRGAHEDRRRRMCFRRHRIDYGGVVDRDGLVRRARRRQALDALAFEGDRAALLTEQLEETIASLEGARVDAAVYAQLSPDDVQLVRAALRDTDHEEAVFDAQADAEASPDDADDAQEDEEEILRLQGELDLSGRLQAALERYLDVL